MGQDAEQPTQPNVNKIIGAGMGISFVAIAVFLVLWFGLGVTGLGVLPRLIVSVCVPPFVMGVVVLVIYFNRRNAED